MWLKENNPLYERVKILNRDPSELSLAPFFVSSCENDNSNEKNVEKSCFESVIIKIIP